MTRTPVDAMLASIDWEACPPQEQEGDLPFVTHTGELYIGDTIIRCVRLSDGRRLLNSDDVERFLGTKP